MNTFPTIMKIGTRGEKIMLIPNMSVRAIPDHEPSMVERFYICMYIALGELLAKEKCNAYAMVYAI